MCLYEFTFIKGDIAFENHPPPPPGSKVKVITGGQWTHVYGYMCIY